MFTKSIENWALGPISIDRSRRADNFGGGISFWDVLYVDFEDIYNLEMKILFFGLLEVVFKLRDLSRSTQLVELYKIARNQLLGGFIRRILSNLMLWGSNMLQNRSPK